jgi:ribosome-associated protein
MRKKKTEITDESLLDVIIEAIQEKKGEQIVKVDLRELKNTLCDYFIICKGESNTKVNALAENVERQASIKLKTHPHHIEGRENSQWILLDYFNVIVHVFQGESREFYKLEDLWRDGKLEIISD